MPRFAVLEHDSPRGLHWDLLLETGPALTTWALAARPDSAGPIAAESLADHRIEYLEYEGPVSGDRGSVTRWDAGTYQYIRQTDRELILAVDGDHLRGEAVLKRLEGEARQWTFEMTSSRDQSDGE